jgi:hypothetical protein
MAPSRRERRPWTPPTWLRRIQGESLLSAYTLRYPNMARGATRPLPRTHGKQIAKHHANHMAMDPAGTRTSGSPRQPARFPPSRAAAPMSKILHPASFSPHFDETRTRRSGAAAKQTRHHGPSVLPAGHTEETSPMDVTGSNRHGIRLSWTICPELRHRRQARQAHIGPPAQIWPAKPALLQDPAACLYFHFAEHRRPRPR